MKTHIKDHEDWISTWLEARMWHCGDDDCNCFQPQLDRVSPNLQLGYPRVKRVRLWSGTFRSEPTLREYQQLERELRQVKEVHKIPSSGLLRLK